jgi:hypothetical protein
MGFLEERLYRSAYAHAQGSRAAANLAQIDAQLRRLSARTGVDAGGYFRDPYFAAYLLGILDSITHLFETETRKRVGYPLHRKFYVDYLRKRFHCTREEARHSFDSTVQTLEMEGISAGFADGCADGLAFCRGGASKARLFWHLMGRNPPRMSPPQIRRDEVTQDFITPPFLIADRQAV